MIALSEVSSLLSAEQSYKRRNDRYYRKIPHFTNKTNYGEKKINEFASSAPVEFHFIFTIYMDPICTTLHGYLKTLRNHFQLNCQHLPVAVSLV